MSGPILFNIFINDIPKINSLPEITTSTTIYADDVQLLFSGTPNNLLQLKIYAETSLKSMKEWYSETGFKMNSIKTQCILFATPNNALAILNNYYNIYIYIYNIDLLNISNLSCT